MTNSPLTIDFIFVSTDLYDDHNNVNYEQTEFPIHFLYNGYTYSGTFDSKWVKCNVPVTNCYWISSNDAEDIEFFKIVKTSRKREKDQATKGLRRMPRYVAPKKDVTSCEKLR